MIRLISNFLFMCFKYISFFRFFLRRSFERLIIDLIEEILELNFRCLVVRWLLFLKVVINYLKKNEV